MVEYWCFIAVHIDEYIKRFIILSLSSVRKSAWQYISNSAVVKRKKVLWVEFLLVGDAVRNLCAADMRSDTKHYHQAMVWQLIDNPKSFYR